MRSTTTTTCKRLLVALAAVLLVTTAGLGDSYQKGQLAISLSAVTASGAGTSFALPMIGEARPSLHTWTVVSTGANPTAITVNLEGSLDGTHWFTLDTIAKADTAGAGGSGWVQMGSDWGEQRWTSNKPMLFVRCNAATITRSASETVTCSFISSNT